MTSTLMVDDLQFEVRWSGKRKTLGLTVDREGELILSAPHGTEPGLLEQFVREKRFWLYSKLAAKEALQPRGHSREFVSGEGFSYLGRSYRLLLVEQQDVSLKLERGRFRLRRCDARRGREAFVDWYTDRATRWLRRRIQPFAERMGASPTGVSVLDLGFRWGSCGRNGVLNFHWSTILLPAPVVDYVIVHELAHLTHVNHTPEFWAVVERALPDAERRKRRLAELGSSLASL